MALARSQKLFHERTADLGVNARRFTGHKLVEDARNDRCHPLLLVLLMFFSQVLDSLHVARLADGLSSLHQHIQVLRAGKERRNKLLKNLGVFA